MKKYCCDKMDFFASNKCEIHSNPFDCPDNLIYYNEVFNEYGLIIHDGGESCCVIEFCPWCGSKLPESKRDFWFNELEKLGYLSPFEQEIPEKFKSSKWRE